MFYTFDFGVQIVNICQESTVIFLDLKKCLTFYVFIETLDKDKLIAATVRVCSGAVKIVFYFYVFDVTFIQQQQQQ